MNNSRVWPSEAIVAAVIVAVIMFLTMLLFSSCQQGKVKSTPTTVAKKVAATTTTTTLQPIPTTDIEELTSYRVEYRRACAVIESVKTELEPIMAKPRSKWTTKELTTHYVLDFDLEQAEKQRDAAIAKYKALSEKYGDRLQPYGLDKRLER